MSFVANQKQFGSLIVSVAGFVSALKDKISGRSEEPPPGALAERSAQLKADIDRLNRLNAGEAGERDKMQDLRSALYSKD